MEKRQKFIGKLKRYLPDIAYEYQKFATEDEEAGKLLLANGKYRHATYFFVQAMEKHVRYKIFSLVNAETEYFRDRTTTHNLDELLSFLADIINGNQVIQNQFRDQLETFVLDGVRFGKLHNDLRYPFYSERSNSFAVLQVDKDDAELTLDKLQRLKLFLLDIDKFKRI